MSDFLTRLAERQLGQTPTIEPRVAPLYAPVANRFDVGSIVEEAEQPSMSQPSGIAARPSSLQPSDKSSLATQPLSRDFRYSADTGSKIEAKDGRVVATIDKNSPLHLVSPSVGAAALSTGATIDFPPRYKPEIETSKPVSLVARGDRGQRLGGNDEEAPVHVTIGRIEVTALTTAAAPKRAPASRKPGMSLDEYLSRRQRREK
jgi:hypothetical protein